jgi:hypothetical protein
MSTYQQRMTRFVWAGNIYLVVCPIALWYFAVGSLGWVVYASTGLIHFCLAVGLDAVYDSLREKVQEAILFQPRRDDA